MFCFYQDCWQATIVCTVLDEILLDLIVYALSVTGTSGTYHPVISPAVKIIEEFHTGKIISGLEQKNTICHAQY
jgi:hypothetical protein